MMKQQVTTTVNQAVQKATERTFSDMAFIDVTEANCPPQDLDYGQVLYISFITPVVGHMILEIPAACKKLIVENIYGTNWDKLKVREIDDCLLELLNVLAGNFLSEYPVKEHECDISLPIIMFDAQEFRERVAVTDYYFDAEGFTFRVALNLASESRI
jgi:hypothetical protein